MAEDIVQETFARLALQRPPKSGSFRPWLYRVATNLAVDDARRRSRRSRLLRRRSSAQPLGDAPEDPGAAVERAEIMTRVRAALAAVPARDRTVLLLREEGFGHREIAEAVGTTTKSVGTMIARAMARVRAELDRDRDGR